MPPVRPGPRRPSSGPSATVPVARSRAPGSRPTRAPAPLPDIAAVTGPDGTFQLSSAGPGDYELAAATDDASTVVRFHHGAGSPPLDVRLT